LRLDILTIGGVHEEFMTIDGDLLLEQTADVHDVDGCIAISGLTSTTGKG
jgi:hypothetical protein